MIITLEQLAKLFFKRDRLNKVVNSISFDSLPQVQRYEYLAFAKLHFEAIDFNQWPSWIIAEMQAYGLTFPNCSV